MSMLKMFSVIKFCHFFASKYSKIHLLHYGSLNCHWYNIMCTRLSRTLRLRTLIWQQIAVKSVFSRSVIFWCLLCTCVMSFLLRVSTLTCDIDIANLKLYNHPVDCAIVGTRSFDVFVMHQWTYYNHTRTGLCVLREGQNVQSSQLGT